MRSWEELNLIERCPSDYENAMEPLLKEERRREQEAWEREGST